MDIINKQEIISAIEKQCTTENFAGWQLQTNNCAWSSGEGYITEDYEVYLKIKVQVQKHKTFEELTEEQKDIVQDFHLVKKN